MQKLRDSLYCWIAEHLPRRLLYWSVIQSWAIATSGRYGTTDPTSVLASDLLDRLEEMKRQQAEKSQSEGNTCWQCGSPVVAEMLDCPMCGAAYDRSRSYAQRVDASLIRRDGLLPFLDPTPEMQRSPEFEAIWEVIRDWDIGAPRHHEGRCGATGNHVRAILDALSQVRNA